MANRDSLEGQLRDLDERIARRERHTHAPVGGTGPSADHNNRARPGSDGLVYANNVVASVTPPLARDFGNDWNRIPVGSIWLELGPLGAGWCDFFERIDLGPDWTQGPVIAGAAQAAVMSIQSGAVISESNTAADGSTFQVGTLRTTRSLPGDQSIELQIGNLFQGHDPDVEEWFQYVECEHYLLTQVSADSTACIGIWVYISAANTASGIYGGVAEIDFVTVDDSGSVNFYDFGRVNPLTGWQSNPDYVVRLESTAAGHCKAYFDGELLVEQDLTPTGGPFVGFVTNWNRTNYGGALVDGTNPGVSPRYEAACINMPLGSVIG